MCAHDARDDSRRCQSEVPAARRSRRARRTVRAIGKHRARSGIAVRYFESRAPADARGGLMQKFASHTLAHFARNLAFEEIPPHVVERAKACMIDTIGAAYYGSTLPWSRIILDYARRNGTTGEATVIGTALRF